MDRERHHTFASCAVYFDALFALVRLGTRLRGHRQNDSRPAASECNMTDRAQPPSPLSMALPAILPTLLMSHRTRDIAHPSVIIESCP